MTSSHSPQDAILHSTHEGIGVITINRPSSLNAFNSTVLNAMRSVLDEWESDSAVDVVIFTGQGSKAFAAGADIAELSTLSPSQIIHDYPMAALYEHIESYPKPTIAAIDGLALGGGFELALACDIRVASPKSRFAFPELGLGIIPGAGGTQRLRNVAGRGVALDLILTREMISAEQALNWGIISRVEDSPLVAAQEMSQGLRKNSPLAQRLAREAIKSQPAEGHRVEQLSQSTAFSHSDRAEGMAAFLEKRTPRFSSSPTLSIQEGKTP